MCLKNVERGRGIYVFPSKFAHPRSHPDFWNKWHEFETHFILPDYLTKKDQIVNLDEAKDKLKVVGIVEDEMAALELQLASSADKIVTKERKVGFHENLNLFDESLATLSVSFSRELKFDLAESLLNRVSDFLYLHPYNALLPSVLFYFFFKFLFCKLESNPTAIGMKLIAI
ncbi:hypothetical protein RYX36_004170 [Vicia faba]